MGEDSKDLVLVSSIYQPDNILSKLLVV